MTLSGTLIIARHHESEWNKEGMWTGTRDVHLTQYGFLKSTEMGELLKDLRIDNAYASMQVRAIETLSCMLTDLRLYHVPADYAHALDERDYGDYTGKNKWEMEKLIGEEAFESLRRDWDYPVPNGETLKMVYERIVPFYRSVILPLIEAGRNVLLVSHGNALRALTMYLESIPPEKAREVEMLFGAVVLYKVDEEGHMISKDVRKTPSEVNA
jgi:2,3-bisphosphoglycerate-dependent phosphoglycerate mutase